MHIPRLREGRRLSDCAQRPRASLTDALVTEIAISRSPPRAQRPRASLTDAQEIIPVTDHLHPVCSTPEGVTDRCTCHAEDGPTARSVLNARGRH